MNIAIASGKGGTGKTTVAVNLAALMRQKNLEVAVVDCDVEEPNVQFFLNPTWDKEWTETMFVPRIDEDKCLGESCRKCVELCEFKALIWMVNSVMVFDELCHGCNLCKLACPADAVLDSTRDLGRVRVGSADGIRVYGGLLRVGEAMATPLIRTVKRAAQKEENQIWDCPPGTACPVIAALNGADFAVLVCEPTPFGLHDLKLAVELARVLSIPFGVVINRAGMGDRRVEEYLERENIDLLASIPHSLEAAQAYSKGELLIDSITEARAGFETLWSNILRKTADKATA
ncbi:MAG: ATP-binding protein [Thermodesulfobacteriota bacterium]|nr:ATP-binding protein [Thermodesulfobacteriota bacterium]